MTVQTESLMHVAAVAMASGKPADAYRHFSMILESDSTHWEAWQGKAKAAGWMSTTVDYRHAEMLACAVQAVALCPDAERTRVAGELASEMVSVAIAVHNLAMDQLNRHGVVVVPEQFGLGILNKAKPVPEILERYFEIVTSAILAGSRAIDFAERHGVTDADLYRRTLSMGRNVFIEAVLKATSGASMGYDTVTFRFPSDKVEAVRAVVEKLVPAGRKLDENLVDPRAKAAEEMKTAGGCFIATAAFGTSLHPDLVDLRAYRDEVLMASAAGRLFVAVYYRTSPPVAEVVARCAALRAAVLLIVVRPMLAVARRTLRRSSACSPL